mmetsp:Transcript_61900/g.98063  ORF Transcript_61900/g.98063 Transcript_61900/m.98063 type:complete len:611 (-) Transcript_61900:40-1872(-)
MDSARGTGSCTGFIEEDDNASSSAAFDSVGLSSVVQQILAARKNGETKLRCLGELPGLSSEFQPPLQERTDKLRTFSEASASILAKKQTTSTQGAPSALGVKTFLDLQGYDLDSVADKRKAEPGSILLIYMFYSRIFEKLVGKQRGVDVPLFAPIDLSERNLGFRGLIEFANDFKLCPLRVGRREMERIFVTVHANLDDNSQQSPRKKFESKLTYYEFLDFLAYCGDSGEPMDRSKIDGSRIRTDETRLERVKRLSLFLSLPNVKKVRLALHNAYRDVHFWKLSDGADFEREARVAEMRSRPQWRVEPLPVARRLSRDGIDAQTCKYLDHFTWLPNDQIWEEYELPILDMGTAVIGGADKHFRLTLTNRQLILARVRLEVIEGGPLRLPWRDTMLGPGQSIEVNLDFCPVEVGEWCGSILASAEWRPDVYEAVTIPTYMRVLQSSGTSSVSRQLPWHAPRPFRPGSARRVLVDPASITPHQLRPRTAQRSRSTTCPSTRPTSACSGASYALPPRIPSRNSSRPGSGMRGYLPPDSAEAAATAAWRERYAASRKSSRPHSAPISSPDKDRLGTLPSDMAVCSGHGLAVAGGGYAAVRSRPRSASVRRQPTM